ncbi:MAG: DnaA/Hda family protein [Candidatus Thermoplasmatota archaeon]
MNKLRAIIIFGMFLILPILSITPTYTESYENSNSRTRATTYGSSWTQTTQADFDAGTKENVSTSASPGDVILSTTTATSPALRTLSSSYTALGVRGATYNFFCVDPSTGEVYWSEGFGPAYGAASNSYTVYPTITDFTNNVNGATYTFPVGRDGTYHVVYGGFLYYNEANTNNMIKLTVKTSTYTRVTLTNAGFRNTYHWNWGGYTDIDFMVDESGLWVMYSTSSAGGQVLISKLDLNLNIQNTWQVPITKTSKGYAFIVGGKAYFGTSYNSPNIDYCYDTATSTGGAYTNALATGAYVSHVSYNPTTNSLYVVDNSNHYEYANIGGVGSYNSPGTLISSVFDTGISNTKLEWLTIKWTATLPSGTSIKFNTRTSGDNTTWSSWSSDYTVSGSAITSPSNRYIQYMATLSTTTVSVTPSLSDVTITYNRKAQAPNLSLPTNNSYLNKKTPTFQLYSNDDDLDSLNYKIELSTDNFTSIYRAYDADTVGWSSSTYSSGTLASFTVSINDQLPEGYYYWRAYANDSSGLSAVSQTYYFCIDVSVPSSFVKQLREYTNKTSFDVEWFGYDSLSGIKYYDIQYSNDSVNWNDWLVNVEFTSAIWQNTTDGNKVYFRARATDRAGNVQSYFPKPDSYTTVDVSLPVSKIEALNKYQNSEMIYLRWGGSDKTSGIEHYKIYVSENDKEYKLYLNTSSDSTLFKGFNGIKYSFYSVAVDKAGNFENKAIGEVETTIDYIPPISSVEKLEKYQNKERFNVSWYGKDEVSGIANYTIYYSDEGTEYKKWLGTENKSAEFNGIHGHTYSFYSIAVDVAGNVERKINPEAMTMVDVITPVSRVLQLPLYQTSKKFEVYWEGKDNGSGIEKYNIYVSENNGLYRLWLESITITFGIFNGSEGNSYSFYSIAFDKAGNAEKKEPIAEATTTIDTSPPWAYVHALPRYINSSNFEVKWSGGDLTGNISTYTIYVSDNDAPYYIWLDNVTTNSSFFSGKDGHTYKFIAMARDLSGNVFQRPFIADAYTTVDISHPIINSLLINYGINSTNSLIVNLNIRAYDEISGLDKMSFSNDNNLWSAWEIYSENKLLWNLAEYGGTSEGGGKIVYIRVIDKAGNIGYGKSDVIILTVSDIYVEDIKFLPNPVILGSTVTIQATIINNAEDSARDVIVGFYTGDTTIVKTQIGSYTIPELKPWMKQKITIFYEPKFTGEFEIFVIADLDNKYEEIDEKNNELSGLLFVDLGLMPESIDISINNGSLYTSNRTVNLRLNAENASMLSLSNDNVVWSEWLKYSENYEWLLSTGDGEKIVYFKTKSSRGESNVIHSKIILDTTPPDSIILSLPQFTKETEFTVSWSGNDALSGIMYYTVQYSNDRNNWTDWLTNVSFTTALWSNSTYNETIYFRCRAIDIVGNVEEYPIAEDAYTTVMREEKKVEVTKPVEFPTYLIAVGIGLAILLALIITVLGMIATRRRMKMEIQKIPLVIPEKKPKVLTELKVVEKYTFDRFVVSESNKFPYEAAFEVAKKPGKSYNPLLIYGPIGTGKTHLVNAIANHTWKEKPGYKIYYTTPDDFGVKLAVPEDTEMLIMDDIQFLAAREDVQEKFFYAFNALYQAEKQIVLTSDRPPVEIEHLQDRLRSRFESGLMAWIKPPELSLRVVIVRRIAKEKGIELPDDVVHFISLTIDTNIRDLVASVEKVIAYASLQNKSITEEVAKEALGAHAHFIRPKLSDRTIEELFKDFGTTIERKEVKEEVKEVEKVTLAEIEEISEYEKKVKDCEEKIKSAEAMGADVSLPSRMLIIAKSHLRRKNYEYAEKYLRRTENSLEEAISKVKTEKGILKLVTGETGECFGCRKEITKDMAILRCSCGSLFHEECAGKFETCPNCFIEWEEV